MLAHMYTSFVSFYLRLSISLTVAKCYYLTPSWMNAAEGATFCVNHCNSNIASVSSNQSFQQAIHTIQSTSVFNTGEKNAFIGLYSLTLGSFQWVDGTSFAPGDFGYNISGGQYPWKPNAPNSNKNETCVEIGFTSDKWNDLPCYRNNRILCNDCSGKLNKYFVINLDSAAAGTNYTTAKTNCEQYSTTLAGIHTMRDQREANIFSNMTKVSPVAEYKDYLWIGYFDIGPVDNYMWEDGMPGTQYVHENGGWPWRNEKPDDFDQTQNCVILEWDIDAQKYQWNDKECNHNHHALCNIPSELCESITMWTDIYGNANFSNCELYAQDSIVMIDGKQWNNINNLLVIDYAYSIQTINNSQSASSRSGLIISECQNPLICNHYFIGIVINDTHQTISLQFYHGDSNSMELLSSAILSINISVFFIIETKIEADVLNNNLLFNITIEYNARSDAYISYSHKRNGSFLFDTYSGYIGIISENSQSHAKSLYISGTPWLITPTPMPTTYPTSPTSQPSDTPSKMPSTTPSFNPSLTPTKTPTKYPTDNPTKIPSQAPIIIRYPTKYPTDNPTDSPLDSGEIIVTTRYVNTTFSKNKAENDHFNDPLIIVIAMVVIVVVLCIVVLCVYMIILYRKKKKSQNNNQAMVELHSVTPTCTVKNTKKNICETQIMNAGNIENEKEEETNSDSGEEMYDHETLGSNEVSPATKGNSNEFIVEDAYELDDTEEDGEEMYEEMQTTTR